MAGCLVGRLAGYARGGRGDVIEGGKPELGLLYIRGCWVGDQLALYWNMKRPPGEDVCWPSEEDAAPWGVPPPPPPKKLLNMPPPPPPLPASGGGG